MWGGTFPIFIKPCKLKLCYCKLFLIVVACLLILFEWNLNAVLGTGMIKGRGAERQGDRWEGVVDWLVFSSDWNSRTPHWADRLCREEQLHWGGEEKQDSLCHSESALTTVAPVVTAEREEEDGEDSGKNRGEVRVDKEREWGDGRREQKLTKLRDNAYMGIVSFAPHDNLLWRVSSPYTPSFIQTHFLILLGHCSACRRCL